VASASCTNGTCAYVCQPGFGDCRAAPPDVDGCETPLDTTTDCAGCGNACDAVSSLGATCDGSRCVYAGCAPGHIDCNAAAPDTDGCECATPSCCGSACQTTHANGMGQSFYDCTPVGTWDATHASEACVAFTGSAAACTDTKCSGSTKAMCGTSGAGCACWVYAGKGPGTVAISAAACSCTGDSTSAWN
jgi:hypothetical protein